MLDVCSKMLLLIATLQLLKIVMAHDYSAHFPGIICSFAVVWDEASDQDGVRPSDIAVLLFADCVYYA